MLDSASLPEPVITISQSRYERLCLYADQYEELLAYVEKQADEMLLLRRALTVV